MKRPGRRLRFDEWSYVLATIGMFVFSPELRRLVDWRTHFNPFNVFSILPTLMLVPIAVLVYRRRRALSRTTLASIAIVWLLACSYAFVVAVLHKQLVAGLFGLSQFALPLAIGAWLLTRDEELGTAVTRLSSPLLAFGAIASAYGIYQYVTAPPWDTAWMTSLDAGSFGVPVPFGIRVYSVLNAPGPFANFLMLVILYNLPNMRPSRSWSMLCTLLCVAGLALSLVRSAWLGLLIGVVTFVIVNPRRTHALTSLLVLTSCLVAGVVFLSLDQNDVVRDVLSQRFATFSDLREDASGEERRETAVAALGAALANPAGLGLGMTGVGYKLVGDESGTGLFLGVIDQGYVSRLLEMGLPGFAGFLFLLGGGIVVAARAHTTLIRRKDYRASAVTAAMLAVQAGVLTIEAAGDNLIGFTLVFYFFAVALSAVASRKATATPVARDRWMTRARSSALVSSPRRVRFE